MGNLNLGELKKSKVAVEKKNMEAQYQDKKLALDGKFGNKYGTGISLPKGNPPINK